jgi:hypothetical protein
VETISYSLAPSVYVLNERLKNRIGEHLHLYVNAFAVARKSGWVL